MIRAFILSMHMDLNAAALVPSCEQDTALAAVVLHIFQGIHHVGDEAEAEGEAADDTGPNTIQEEVR